MVKFAYITDVPIEQAYSGTAARIRAALIAEGHEVSELFVPIPDVAKVRVAKFIFARFGKRVLITKREPATLKKLHSVVATRLAGMDVDVIFSHYDWLIPFYQPSGLWRKSRFVVTWPDNYFGDFYNFYSGPWASRSIRNGWQQTQRYYETADLTVFSSEWAYCGAARCEIVKKDERRVEFIPYGVNLCDAPGVDMVQSLIRERFRGKLKFIWIGHDPDRKGLATAVDVVDVLNKRGCHCELVTIGYTGASLLHPQVRHLGKLDRRKSSENEIFRNELGAADFLLLPTKADCTPMVFGEAACFGVPSLAFAVGGVGSVVLDGVTGRLFPGGTCASEIADYVESLSRSDYLRLASAARQDTDERLNWKLSIRRFLAAMRVACPNIVNR